jgi:pimeloyl-ACP methyl ester carboxylesterase
MSARLTHESFETRDGVALRFSRHATGSRAVILVAPGIFMHRDSDEHRLLATRLAELADVVRVDIRGHGDSGGAFSFGVEEPEDLAELAARLRRDYDRVAGLGFSFGGYHTCVAAARHACFDAVALVGTPHRLFIFDHNFLTWGLARSLKPMVGRRRRLTRVAPRVLPRRPAASTLIARVAPRPLLIVHGADDWLIPAKHAQRLFDRAGAPKTLVLIERGLHAENMLADEPEALLAPLTRFFRSIL